MSRNPCWLLAALLAVLPAVAAAEQQVGQALFAKGAVTAHSAGEAPRLLGNGSPLNQGDIITTGRGSVALIELNDGSHITIRPDSVFSVEQFEHGQNKENAVLRLFKGGLRAVTGLISKRNPNGYTLNTAVATIGIRGTDFAARLCDADCAAESKNWKPVELNRSAVVGRVAFSSGDLSSHDSEGHTRTMVTGAPLYVGDMVETGPNAIAVLAFRDETRITLSKATQFKIEDQRFDQAAPEQGSAIFRLVRGGLRAVTGLIGQRNPQAVKFNTPVATIGIRGTGFDLICQGTCVGTATPRSEIEPLRQFGFSLLRALITNTWAAGLPAGDGLYANVWKGSIVFQEQQFEVKENQAAFLSGPGGRPQQIDAPLIPSVVALLPQPAADRRPDKVAVDMKQTFGAVAQAGTEPGLHVNVVEGHVTVTNDKGETNLGTGEEAYTDQQGNKPERSQSEKPILGDATLGIKPDTPPAQLPDTFGGKFDECEI